MNTTRKELASAVGTTAVPSIAKTNRAILA